MTYKIVNIAKEFTEVGVEVNFKIGVGVNLEINTKVCVEEHISYGLVILVLLIDISIYIIYL